MTRTIALSAALLALTACSCPCPEPAAHDPAPVAPTAAAVAPTTTATAVAVAPQTVKRITQTRISIDVEGADLNDVMDQIGEKVGWNILVDPQVQETVTITLRDVPWREAVDIIAKITRCDVVEIKRTY